MKVAHFRLCHSRKPFVVAYPGESQEMVLDAFVRALSFYGGVPRRVIIDNPKTMVTYVSRSKDRVFHPRFLALTNHYVMEPVARNVSTTLSIRVDQAVFGVHVRSALTSAFAISISLRNEAG